MNHEHSVHCPNRVCAHNNFGPNDALTLICELDLIFFCFGTNIMAIKTLFENDPLFGIKLSFAKNPSFQSLHEEKNNRIIVSKKNR